MLGLFWSAKKTLRLPMLACQCHKASGRSLTMVTFDNKSSLGCSAMSFGRPLKLLDVFLQQTSCCDLSCKLHVYIEIYIYTYHIY